MEHRLFPYDARPNQVLAMALIAKALKKGEHVVMESGTGSGKTICSLAPTVEFALKKGKKVLYLTRTNSQQRQVISELRQISRKAQASKGRRASKKSIFGVGIQGRHVTCPRLKEDPALAEGSSEELSKLCNEWKARTLKGQKGGCRHYESLRTCDTEKLIAWARENLPTVEEWGAHCRELGICPYEANKLLIPHATLVTAPYIYFFERMILRPLLDWMNVALEDVIAIIDEAHNLPEYAREIRSMDLSIFTCRAAEREAEAFGDAELLPGTSVADVCRLMQDILGKVCKEYVIEDDGLLPPSEVETHLMGEFKVTNLKLMALWDEMVKYGEIVSEHKRMAGKLPRSYTRYLGVFMMAWMTIEEVEFVKLVRGGENPGLEVYSLDPATAAKPLLECHSTIHMSGTLAPLDEYRDSLGLPGETRLARFPSPFPPENRAIIFSPDVTTKYEEYTRDKEVSGRIRGHLAAIAAKIPRNTIFFYPSFNMMSSFDGIARETGRSAFSEKQGMTQHALMEMVGRFKSSEGGVLSSVMGGRISEGLDFPERELEVAVIVGIPYPKPTAKQKTLLRYYDAKFGKGWEYTVRAPTARKLLQSIGRLIRTERDRGIAVILDRRAINFKGEMPDLMESADVVGDIESFFAHLEKGGTL